MKKVYLVHCWDGTSNDGWYPWIEKELKKYNVEVLRFDMPDTANPKMEEWVSTLNEKVDKLDEETYFMGHSIGCQTIMRYLGTKETTKIGGILFVAPWLDLLPEAVGDEDSYNTAYPWIHTTINFEKVKEFSENINCIFSDDDYFVDLKQEQEFKQKLNAKTIIVNEKGHISQDDDIFELDEILELSKSMLGV